VFTHSMLLTLIVLLILFNISFLAHNVTGRLFEAFTNNTFHTDYTITVYPGYGELNSTALTPYETIDYIGNGDYYTGFYELFDLPTGAYVAIVESLGYVKNFQRFYAF